MKGVIFTLDAIFALSIAVASISILLYFNYYGSTPYSLLYSNTQSTLSDLLTTPVASLQNSSALAKTMANQFAGVNATWPQFMQGPSRNDSSDFGPIKPIISSVFYSGNAITRGVVADYGNIYVAAGNTVYAVNATTNKVVWSKSGNTIVSNLALYSGTLIFENSTNMTELNAMTGATIRGKSATPLSPLLLVYDNKILFCGAANSLSIWYENNLSATGWANTLSSNPVSAAVVNGDIAVKTATNTLALVAYPMNPAALQLWSSSPPSITTNLAARGSKIYFGSSTATNTLYVNGTRASGFPSSASVTGLANYKNYFVYQSANSVFALSPANALLWSNTIPSYFGTAITNATPAISGKMVYTLWSNGLAGQDLSNGTIEWFSQIPGAKTQALPYMTLAYGRLYVVVGANVLAYGSCGVPIYSSALSAIATLNLNGAQGCAGALSSALLPSSNYTVSVGNASAHSVLTASFAGNGNYLTARNSAPLNTTSTAVSFWVKIGALPSSGVRLVNYGDPTCPPPLSGPCGWYFSLMNVNSNAILQFSAMNTLVPITATSANALSLNSWYYVAGTYNDTAADLYINGVPVNVVASPGTIALEPPTVNLTIGAGLRSNTIYFTGNIADLQIYSVPLNSLQISQIYLRGLQGAPLSGLGLVAWYPLEGDTNDYALFNPGYNNGVVFAPQNYTLPSLANAYSISQSSVMLPLLNYSTGADNDIKVGVYTWR
jgi:hypothetical protein